MPSKPLPNWLLFFQLLLDFKGQIPASARRSEVPRSHTKLLRKNGSGGMCGKWQVDKAVEIKLILG